MRTNIECALIFFQKFSILFNYFLCGLGTVLCTAMKRSREHKKSKKHKKEKKDKKKKKRKRSSTKSETLQVCVDGDFYLHQVSHTLTNQLAYSFARSGSAADCWKRNESAKNSLGIFFLFSPSFNQQLRASPSVWIHQYRYTNEINPFRDPNLSQPFVWKKRDDRKSTEKVGIGIIPMFFSGNLFGPCLPGDIKIGKRHTERSKSELKMEVCFKKIGMSQFYGKSPPPQSHGT